MGDEVAKKQVVIKKDEEAKTLTLAVTGQAGDQTDPYLANYDQSGVKKLTIKATTNDTGLGWTVAPEAAVFKVSDDKTELTITLNDSKNVLADGAVITVTAKTTNVTDKAPLKFVVRPTIKSLGIVKDHYVFEEKANSWYALDLSGDGIDMSNITGLCAVTTEPATDDAYSQLNWKGTNTVLSDYTEPTTGKKNLAKRSFTLKKGATTISVWLKSDADDSGAKKQNVAVRDPASKVALANSLQFELEDFLYAGAGHFQVVQENSAKFNQYFDAKWSRAEQKLPQAYAANKELKFESINVKVAITPATSATTVSLRASVYFNTQNGPEVVQVNPSDKQINGDTTPVSFGNSSAKTIPNEVMLNDPLLVFWEAKDSVDNLWKPLQVTANTVYVTAAMPVEAAAKNSDPMGTKFNNSSTVNAELKDKAFTYDSLLSISCKAIVDFKKGSTDADDVRAGVARAFVTEADGTNNRMVRLNRDTKGAATPSNPFVYWKPGNDNVANSLNSSTKPILDGGNFFTNVDDNMQCSIWAQMLIAMWALHGLGDGMLIVILPGEKDTDLYGDVLATGYTTITDDTEFMVQNWSYNNKSQLKADSYTHDVKAAVNASSAPLPDKAGTDEAAPVNNGVAGQNNLNPWESFCNHWIVRVGTTDVYYDPSYGTGPFKKAEWINASVAGLVSTAKKAGFAKTNGTPTYGVTASDGAVALFDISAKKWIP